MTTFDLRGLSEAVKPMKETQVVIRIETRSKFC